LNFIAFYGVLLEFEKRMSVNMQEINSKLWIMGRIMEGAIKMFIATCLKTSFPLRLDKSSNPEAAIAAAELSLTSFPGSLKSQYGT